MERSLERDFKRIGYVHFRELREFFIQFGTFRGCYALAIVWVCVPASAVSRERPAPCSPTRKTNMTDAIKSHATRLSVARVAMTGAFATLNLFLLAWVWAAIGLSGADAFLGLFTNDLITPPPGSLTALWIGGSCAFLVGGLFGALIAHCYYLAGWALGSEPSRTAKVEGHRTI